MSSTGTSMRTSSGLRSEEHTSELQSRQYLVCRLLLEKNDPRPRYVATPHLRLVDPPPPDLASLFHSPPPALPRRQLAPLYLPRAPPFHPPSQVPQQQP